MENPSLPPSLACITIWQPWASLIMYGLKRHEWRTWYPPRALIGQRIGIHAGTRLPTLTDLQDLARDPESIMGPVENAESIRANAWIWLQDRKDEELLPRGALLGTVTLVGARPASEICGGSPNMIGWELSGAQLLGGPWPMEGWQKFWTFERGQHAYHDRLADKNDRERAAIADRKGERPPATFRGTDCPDGQEDGQK